MKPIDDDALDTMRQRLELAERADLPADMLRAVLARLDAAEAEATWLRDHMRLIAAKAGPAAKRLAKFALREP